MSSSEGEASDGSTGSGSNATRHLPYTSDDLTLSQDLGRVMRRHIYNRLDETERIMTSYAHSVDSDIRDFGMATAHVLAVVKDGVIGGYVSRRDRIWTIREVNFMLVFAVLVCLASLGVLFYQYKN